MGRKKATPVAPPPREDEFVVVVVRCRVAYKKWLSQFARSERVTPSHLVDQGLFHLAKLRGFDPPPDR